MAQQLPFLPGYTFEGPKTGRQGMKSTFDVKNGFVTMKPSGTGITPEVTEEELNELANATGKLTYRPQRETVSTQATGTVPAHEAFDKQVLTFTAWFMQIAPEDRIKEYIRHVKIFYYLEDDTISIIEPTVENCGLLQGKFLKRQRVPKDTAGGLYEWADLNVGITATMFGTPFHLYDCNAYTQKHYESNGVALNWDAVEDIPVDEYLQSRVIVDQPDTSYQTPSDFDKLKQFVALDRKVLRFYAAWDDGVENGSGVRPFIIHYFLVDNSLEVREIHHKNDSRDPFPKLVARQKINKNFKQIPDEFPTVIMELPTVGVDALEQVSPADFRLGNTINICGRDMLVYDCDEFTREFYRLNFGVTDFTPISIAKEAAPSPRPVPPPYTGYGTPEDSLASVTNLVPKVPKTNFLKILEFDSMTLRFAARMHPCKFEDQERRFIISYQLASDKIGIWETPAKNSGFWSGKYLDACLCPRPESDVNAPTYYGMEDFVNANTLTIYKVPFLIDGADQFVIDFMKKNPAKFAPGAAESFEA
jgi:hypothetical protein